VTRTYYWIVSHLLRYVFLPLYTRIAVAGLESLPRSGPLIVVCNHLNDGDPLILASRLPRRVVFMTKAELLRVPVLGVLIRLFGAFPVRRNQADLTALHAAADILSRGLAVVIFPEGRTTTNEARLSEALPGAALVALRYEVPVMPVAITGSQRLQLPWFFLRAGRRYDVTLTFGEPFLLPKPPRLNTEATSAATGEIMRRIAALLPESYQGYYGSRPVTNSTTTGPGEGSGN
jgi:1-acyl-sn-glycerol-3-phosphate acyltransferase